MLQAEKNQMNSEACARFCHLGLGLRLGLGLGLGLGFGVGLGVGFGEAVNREGRIDS